MCAAQVEHERIPLALENETQIEPATALHKGRDAAKAQTRVKVWLAKRHEGGLHDGEHLVMAGGRNTFEEARRGEFLHGARSAAVVISRRVPERRARALSRFRRRPAFTLSAAVSPYSAVK